MLTHRFSHLIYIIEKKCYFSVVTLSFICVGSHLPVLNVGAHKDMSDLVRYFLQLFFMFLVLVSYKNFTCKMPFYRCIRYGIILS